MRHARLFALAWFAGCTFPSPDISPPCTAPSQCQMYAQSCSAYAQKIHTQCLDVMGQCKPTFDCANCEQTYQKALSDCVTKCVQCSAGDGCYDANASCQAVVQP